MKWSGGSKSTWDAQVLIVPKSEGLLKATHPTLIDTIDFGIFKFLAAPMLWLLNWLFGVVGNYGIAIVLLTLIVKTLLFPITDMSYRSMAKMKEIQPELTKLRAKYESDRQMQAQKQMELFKEKGVNPAGGCLPMLLQIPVWFALYSTLRVAVELYGAPFIPGWIDDLTLSDPVYVMPLLLGVLFFFQQKLQPTPSDNPSQQMVMKIMPVMMTVFMIALPAGLVLYILFNTILGIAHQYYAIKRDQKPVAEAAA
jgi:YidC/Oxa1 family membrane protein insertase